MIRKSNAVDKVRGEFKKLVKEAEVLAGVTQHSGENRPLGPVHVLGIHLGQIKTTLRRLGSPGKGSRPLLVDSITPLFSSVSSMKRETNRLRRGVVGRAGSPGKVAAAIRTVDNRLDKLHLVARRLVKDAKETRERQNAENPAYDTHRILRTAISRLDSKLGKELKLEDLDGRLDELPPFDEQDAEQVRRVAKIYVLSRITAQTWEVRYRSDKPGGRLALVAEFVNFPTREDIGWCVEQAGYRNEFVVAARLPRWQVVSKVQAWDY